MIIGNRLSTISDAWNTIRRWIKEHPKRIVATVMLFAHGFGAFTAVRVIMEHRSPQGAAAWAMSLVTFPYVAVPAYWFFGDSNFSDYQSDRMAVDDKVELIYEDWLTSLPVDGLTSDSIDEKYQVLEKLVGMPFTSGNRVELLIDGEETFNAVFEAIDSAKDYILAQYFTVENDELGKKLQQRLITKAKEGVRVYFLFDELGSIGLGGDYIEPLKDAGVDIRAFSSNVEGAVDFRLNFRNHRKILVVDGHVAVTGGCNVGDAYLGRDPKIGPWRDTNVKVQGPIVQGLQVAFAEDWRWVTRGKLSNLCWVCPKDHGGSADALCLPMGPAGQFETCALFYHALIGAAKERLWIATPYFVPDMPIVTGLQLAALRGVDVKVLIPEEPDSKLVYYSAHTYLESLEKAGVKILWYPKDVGFLHQKVVLVDDDFASVGTANFDNRSFHLNFEVNIAVQNKVFASKVAAMLEKDFAHGIPAKAAEFHDKSFPFRFSAHAARLLAPIQ